MESYHTIKTSVFLQKGTPNTREKLLGILVVGGITAKNTLRVSVLTATSTASLKRGEHWKSWSNSRILSETSF